MKKMEHKDRQKERIFNLNPIFKYLYNEISEEKNYQVMNYQKMSKMITMLPDDEIEFIYSLIICYSKIKMIDIGNHIIPYRGAPLKCLRGIQFYISDIPIELQKIISLYLERISSDE
jgi:hypothetical protein